MIANLHAQLKGLYGTRSDAEIDAMMGTTPMAGVNDVQVRVLSSLMLVWSCRCRSVISVWLVSGQSRATCSGGTNLSPEFHGSTKEQV